MKKETKTIQTVSLYTLPTEQLEQLLRQELDGRKDRQTVLQILRILKDRDDALSATVQPSMQESVPKPERSRKLILRVAAVAAVVALLLTVIPPAMGAENIFELLGRWTQDIFSFFMPEEPDARCANGQETDHPGLLQLREAMECHGVTDLVVPTWLPEGFELTEIDITPLNVSKRVTAQFTNGAEYIILSYEIHNKPTSNDYPKDGIDVETLERAGVKHYIVPNEEQWTVIWNKRIVECLFMTNCSKETVTALIASIYTEVK